MARLAMSWAAGFGLLLGCLGIGCQAFQTCPAPPPPPCPNFTASLPVSEERCAVSTSGKPSGHELPEPGSAWSWRGPELSEQELIDQVLARNPSLAQMTAAWEAASARYPQVISF